MNNKFEIKIDVDDIELYQNGNNFGVIYIKINDFLFPQNNWTDFIVIILNWWLCNIEAIKRKRRKTGKFCFMDGPYVVKLKKSENDKIKLKFCDHYKLVIEYEFSIDEIMKEILMKSSEIIEFVKSNKWESKDIDSLNNSIISNMK